MDSVQKNVNAEVHDNAADFSVLFGLILKMVNALGSLAIPHGQTWLNDRQTLAKKFVYHLSTIESIRFVAGQSY
jgi:hypothetical protein